MSTPGPPSFRKTKNGKWAVMAQVAELEKALADGGRIEVTKKSGDKSSFTVGSLGKPFDVDGNQMCYGYSPADSEEDSDQGSGYRQSAKAVPRQAKAVEEAEPRVDYAAAPQDNSEPMPEFQGGSEDEWEDGGW